MYIYPIPFQHDMNIILLPYKKISKNAKKSCGHQSSEINRQKSVALSKKRLKEWESTPLGGKMQKNHKIV